MDNIPRHLESTYKLISDSFPNGIDENQYYQLLAILYEYMSDRCLAEIISLYTKKDYSVVQNDIYKVASNDKLKEGEINLIKEKMQLHGFEEWLKEE